MTEHLILFTGTLDAGKTTAVETLLQKPAVTTEVRDREVLRDPSGAPIGMDHGDLALDNGDCLRVYGIPGQRRFGFMWQALAERAMGLVILVDNSRPDPLADLSIYLENFGELIRETACVIGVGRMQDFPSPDLDSFSDRMHAHGVMCPVLSTDVRDRQDVLTLMDLLFVQLEHRD
jgi:signal recognition particle receptor subunit beta